MAANIKRDIESNRRRTDTMKAPAPGSKEAQLRALRTTSPVGRTAAQTKAQFTATHVSVQATPDTPATVAAKATMARKVMEGAAKALGVPTGPRTGIVEASTIAATGTLAAGPNLDAQAEKAAAARKGHLSGPAGSVEDDTKASATAAATTTAAGAEQENATMSKKAATAARKAKPAKKGAKSSARRAPKSDAARATKAGSSNKDSMVGKVIALASRPQGASPAELNKLTGWKGCPWKWQFSNPKKTGWCDRRGLGFEVKTVDGDTRYCVTTPAKK